MPGVYRTYRIAASRDSKKLSRGSFDAVSPRFHRRSAKMTTRKQAAFRAKSQFDPTIGINMPPNAGPLMPERFSCKPPKAAAEGSSSLETTSGTIEVQSEAFEANPSPGHKITVV